ncbi:glycosyl hydrolase family 61-domain-containing protein [Xylaria scruposa]|nr:glycosyl hydrolase family 61-domain-containing protein [Xylaria scruposa]
MKVSYSLVSLFVTTFSPVSAHWVYNRLIVNGEFVGEPYQYIRPSQNGNNFLSDVNSTDMRCNIGGGSGITNNTETATVKAGDELGFGIGSTFGHPGIQQVYLSRAPDLPPNSTSSSATAVYDGSGGWARIYSLTTTPTWPNGTGTMGKNSFAEARPGAVDWATHKLTSFLFPLPAETPAGEYLLRAEGMAVHAAHKPGGAQFYVSCAQIRVVDDDGRRRRKGGFSELGPLVKIPGVYRGDEPGVLLPEFWSSLTRYTTAGPALWPPSTKEQHVATHL